MKAIFRWIRQTGGLVLRALRLRRSSLGTALRRFLSRHRTDADENPMILAWELGGFPGLFKKNAILATALRVRGYRTHAILCNGIARACIQRGLEEKLEIRGLGESLKRMPCLHDSSRENLRHVVFNRGPLCQPAHEASLQAVVRIAR